MNDLLFKAGFFRLEESGLVTHQSSFQIVLPKNRLLFYHDSERWNQEVEREFPQAFAKLARLREASEKDQGAKLNRAAQDLFDLQKRDPALSTWINAEIQSVLSPSLDRSPLENMKAWLYYLRSRGKSYRADPRLKDSYTHFLLEHARKWGAQILSEAKDLRSKWGSFELSDQMRIRYLILNGLGGGRFVARELKKAFANPFAYWMHTESIECDLRLVPEPLQDFCLLGLEDSHSASVSMSGSHSSLEKIYSLRTLRLPAKGIARLHLGVWLAYEDSKSWPQQIEAGRRSLRKLLPFLPVDCFKPLPELFELIERRGDAVKRGQMDRFNSGGGS